MTPIHTDEVYENRRCALYAAASHRTDASIEQVIARASSYAHWLDTGETSETDSVSQSTGSVHHVKQGVAKTNRAEGEAQQ